MVNESPKIIINIIILVENPHYKINLDYLWKSPNIIWNTFDKALNKIECFLCPAITFL